MPKTKKTAKMTKPRKPAKPKKIKILAFVDMHGSSSALKQITRTAKSENVDLIVCAGDVSIFEQNIYSILKKLDKIGKPVLIIPGNHESENHLKMVCSKLKNVRLIHGKKHRHKDITILGFEGNGFSIDDREFRGWGKRIEKGIKKEEWKKTILVTHAPPYKTQLDLILDSHCGNKDIRRFIERNRPLLVICGHIHENAGVEDRIKEIRVINPGPYGKVIEV